MSIKQHLWGDPEKSNRAVRSRQLPPPEYRVLADYSPARRRPGQQEIAICVSGAGLAGVAEQVGFLATLLNGDERDASRRGYDPVVVSGTSIGSIVAAAIATEDTTTLARQLDWVVGTPMAEIRNNVGRSFKEVIAGVARGGFTPGSAITNTYLGRSDRLGDKTFEDLEIEDEGLRQRLGLRYHLNVEVTTAVNDTETHGELGARERHEMVRLLDRKLGARVVKALVGGDIPRCEPQSIPDNASTLALSDAAKMPIRAACAMAVGFLGVFDPVYMLNKKRTTVQTDAGLGFHLRLDPDARRRNMTFVKSASLFAGASPRAADGQVTQRFIPEVPPVIVRMAMPGEKTGSTVHLYPRNTGIGPVLVFSLPRTHKTFDNVGEQKLREGVMRGVQLGEMEVVHEELDWYVHNYAQLRRWYLESSIADEPAFQRDLVSKVCQLAQGKIAAELVPDPPGSRTVREVLEAIDRTPDRAMALS